LLKPGKGKKHLLKQGRVYAAINASIVAVKGLREHDVGAFTRGDFWAGIGLAALGGFASGFIDKSGVLQRAVAQIGVEVGFAALKEIPLMFLRGCQGR